MNSIEIIAAIFAVGILIKLGLLATMPKQFGKWGIKNWLKNAGSFKMLAFILMLVVGYFVFTNVGIVTIAAVMTFTALLYKFTLMSYDKEMTEMGKQRMKKPEKLISRAWCPLILWVIIAVWTLWALFA